MGSEVSGPAQGKNDFPGRFSFHDDQNVRRNTDAPVEGGGRTSQRRNTKGEEGNKQLAEQCFNNIAHERSKEKGEDNQEVVDNLKYTKGKSNAELKKKLGVNHKNSRSTNNLCQLKDECGSNSSSTIGSNLDENYSHPNKGKSILHDEDIYDEDPEDQNKNNKKDITIGIKSVFGNARPLHEDYSPEDIQKKTESSRILQNKNDYELNFYRNGEEIRKSYITKLICKNVWNPTQKEKTHNSLIIFDWDDTLLCTSFLTPGGVFNENMVLTDKDQEKIARLEFSVLRLLNIAVEKGDVYIITNAGPGWVEFSAEKFYPSLKTVLGKIKIISARGEYESKYPGDSKKWKIQTFLNLQKGLDIDLITNIICLGDSFIEMEAGRILASKFTQAFIKTVKFRESPKPEELNKQLTLVADQFNNFYSSVKNLTIRVEKRKGK